MRRRALLLAALATPALAQQAQGGRIIVPYGPGGSSDIMARILAAHAGAQWVVENRGGGASIPGTQAVASAPPDGSVIGTADNALVVNQALRGDRMPYLVGRDIVGIGLTVTAQLLLVAHPAAPAQTVAQVVAEARATPGGLSLSHGGTGTPTHLASLQFQQASGAEITQVGYRGGGPQLTGLISGDTRYGFVAISSGLAPVQSGALRAIAIAGPGRSPRLPNLPTITEAGLPGVDIVGWWGFICGAGLGPALREQLNAALVAPAREPAVKARLKAQGYGIVASSGAAFTAQMLREIPLWAGIFQRAGVKPE